MNWSSPNSRAAPSFDSIFPGIARSLLARPGSLQINSQADDSGSTWSETRQLSDRTTCAPYKNPAATCFHREITSVSRWTGRGNHSRDLGRGRQLHWARRRVVCTGHRDEQRARIRLAFWGTFHLDCSVPARDDVTSLAAIGGNSRHERWRLRLRIGAWCWRHKVNRRRHKKRLKNFAAPIGAPFMTSVRPVALDQKRRRTLPRVFSHRYWSAEI